MADSLAVARLDAALGALRVFTSIRPPRLLQTLSTTLVCTQTFQAALPSNPSLSFASFPAACRTNETALVHC